MVLPCILYSSITYATKLWVEVCTFESAYEVRLPLVPGTIHIIFMYFLFSYISIHTWPYSNPSWSVHVCPLCPPNLSSLLLLLLLLLSVCWDCGKHPAPEERTLQVQAMSSPTWPRACPFFAPPVLMKHIDFDDVNDDLPRKWWTMKQILWFLSIENQSIGVIHHQIIFKKKVYQEASLFFSENKCQAQGSVTSTVLKTCDIADSETWHLVIPDLPRSSCQNNKTAKSGPVCEPQYGRAVAQPPKIKHDAGSVVLSAVRKAVGKNMCLKKDVGRTAKELERNNMRKTKIVETTRWTYHEYINVYQMHQFVVPIKRDELWRASTQVSSSASSCGTSARLWSLTAGAPLLDICAAIH